MNPRTYLQTRILDRLSILRDLIEIEEMPDTTTRKAWSAVARIIRTYFDIYENTIPPQAATPPDPRPGESFPGLSSPARQTHRTPPEKKVDPKDLIV